MTRYACYWVEDGKMVAPIKTMRFDDSFYNFFGSNLEGVGKEILARPVIETYDGRNPGETTCPGILVNDFELTLISIFRRYFKIGVVPKWFKGPVCKTVIRRFESDRRLNVLPGW